MPSRDGRIKRGEASILCGRLRIGGLFLFDEKASRPCGTDFVAASFLLEVCLADTASPSLLQCVRVRELSSGGDALRSLVVRCVDRGEATDGASSISTGGDVRSP